MEKERQLSPGMRPTSDEPPSHLLFFLFLGGATHERLFLFFQGCLRAIPKKNTKTLFGEERDTVCHSDIRDIVYSGKQLGKLRAATLKWTAKKGGVTARWYPG